MEVDHIYICTDKKAPAGDLLVEFGLREGSSNVHPGQGMGNLFCGTKRRMINAYTIVC